MFKMFSGGGDDGSWPLAKVVSAVKSQYGGADVLGEDGPIKVYGAQDNGVNFVVVLMQSAPGSGRVVELGLLARFIGFPVDMRLVEGLNVDLRTSIAAMEGADIYLMAGLEVTGAFDQRQLVKFLQAWREDLMVTVQRLTSEQASVSAAFPLAKMGAAREFAANLAPAPMGDRNVDTVTSFLGTKAAAHVFCDTCNGRGKRGLLARECVDCDGAGFIGSTAQ